MIINLTNNLKKGLTKYPRLFVSTLLLITFIVIYSIIYLSENFYLVFIIILLNIIIILFTLVIIFLIQKKKQSNNSRTFILKKIFEFERTEKNKPINIAEVGVLTGDYSLKIIKFFLNRNININNFYLIDPYKSFDTEYTEYDQKTLDDCFADAQKKLKKYDFCKFIRKTSSEASREIKNETLDFVYLDGNHKFEYVYEDLNIWFEKVKKNGIIFGDDYLGPYGVQKAVNKFSFEKKLIVHFSDNYKQFFMQKY